MLNVNDSTKERIKIEKIPLKLEKLVVKIDSPLVVSLNNWENAGLRISVYLEGLGHGYFNEKPYPNKKIALKKYQYILKQIKKGNYSLEYYGKNRLKLLLTARR